MRFHLATGFISSRRFLLTGLLVFVISLCLIRAGAQSAAPGKAEVTKSSEGKKEEAERAASRASAHHFDRVLVIALENVDYEAAIQNPDLASLASHGASFSNFHALFHPSYPNYLAMVAGTDFDIHRGGSYMGDKQHDFPDDAEHKTIADRLIGAGLDFKQYAEELPPGNCPWNVNSQHVPRMTWAITMPGTRAIFEFFARCKRSGAIA